MTRTIKVESKYANIGNKIKARRKLLKITQKQCADYIGCTAQQIQKYEDGVSRISLSNFLKICEAINTHPSFFLNDFSFKESEANYDENMESKLLSAFRSIQNKAIRARVLEIVEAIISTTNTSG
ncbi:MAG: helix-turn-helix transcriptional regulator [Alphaproteobacteria bacterium]|nr:helix-turn-helix transcriptional regulator [Alphaproteobacteria bacterium]